MTGARVQSEARQHSQRHSNDPLVLTAIVRRLTKHAANGCNNQNITLKYNEQPAEGGKWEMVNGSPVALSSKTPDLP